jgi:hypothetical protein
MTKQAGPSLNEEQEAQVRKDAGGARGLVFKVHVKADMTVYRPNPAPPLNGEAPAQHNAVRAPAQILVEAERWTDARAFAVRKLGVPEVTLERMPEGSPYEFPRWQVRFEGYAGHTTNPVRMQARLIENANVKPGHGWKDVREIDP